MRTFKRSRKDTKAPSGFRHILSLTRFHQPQRPTHHHRRGGSAQGGIGTEAGMVGVGGAVGVMFG
ncbi:MAG: hypothetical protein R3E79_32825 [Caldilineaceae bacterium]